MSDQQARAAPSTGALSQELRVSCTSRMRRSVRTRLLRERTSAGRPKTSLLIASRPAAPRLGGFPAVGATLARQKVLGKRKPDIHVVIGETALHQEVGGPDVREGQLEVRCL